MSGLVSGIGKVFKSVVSAGAKILPAVAAVGATLFTGGSALGLGALGSGAFAGLAGGGGTIGSVIGGALVQAGIGGLVSKLTGGDFKQGAIAGGASGGISGLLRGAFAGGQNGMVDLLGGGFETGMSTNDGGLGSPIDLLAQQPASGAATSSAINTPTIGSGNNGLTWASALTGLGSGLAKGLGAWQEQQLAQDAIKSRERINQSNIDYLEGKEQRLRDSYHVADSALWQPPSGAPSGGPRVEQPTPPPAQVQAPPPPQTKSHYQYDPNTGRIVTA